MTIAVRVDGSPRIGMGHVMRTLSLAMRLRAAGAEVAFVMRAVDDFALQRVRTEAFCVRELPATEIDATRHPWLGVPVERDVAETAAALGALGAPGGIAWLIADNYGIDERWERPLRAHARAIFAFDDLADRRHDVDALLDQNVVDTTADRYRGLVPTHARIFLGPRYAQLRAAFATHTKRQRDGTIRTVLVSFGSEPGDHALLALEALADAAPDLAVTIVLPDNAPAAPAVDAIAAAHGWQRRRYVDDMAALLDASDLAIGAGGTSAWERAILGVPAIAWSIAENQRATVEGLAAAGAVRVPSRTRAAVTAEIAALRADPAHVRHLGNAARALMDDRDRALAELDTIFLGARPSAAVVR